MLKITAEDEKWVDRGNWNRTDRMPFPYTEDGKVFYKLWLDAVKELSALESALKVFTDIMEEGGCTDCPFWDFYSNGGGSYCGYDREPKPCKQGWREWAITEGKQSGVPVD